MISLPKPAVRPSNPRFSSGPCAKPPGWSAAVLARALVGRSHRSVEGRLRLREAIEKTREILKIPGDFRIGIVPASDTGAVEMAVWSLLGQRPVEVLAWESFGRGWVSDVKSELKLNPVVREAEYGHLPELSSVNFDRDVVFAWNGTTSGVRVPSGDFIPGERNGLVICDATSAVFATEMPWRKLDATTFSWQKVLGGEAAHGMIVLSPRAVERIESFTPPWPIPKIFRLSKNGKLIEGIFEGSTINTPSMICVEDYLFALDWAASSGGLEWLIDRADANSRAIGEFVAARDWIDFLAMDPATRSNTSVCLKFSGKRIQSRDIADFAKSVARRLEREGVAFDIGSYRDAPPGLRIWCGATVELHDIEALLPWLDWAFASELEARRIGRVAASQIAL